MSNEESFLLHNLFYGRNGDPIEFSMRLCREWDALYEKITRYGGILVTKVGPHTIRFLPDCDHVTSSHGDHFKPQYIHDCIQQSKLLPIGDYRVQTHSNYDDQIDPMDILLGIHSWSDCQRLKTQRNYTPNEKRAILNFIVENKRFQDVKGRALWTEMETKKVCIGRSWQSMKEHYCKKLIHELPQFKLKGIVVRRILYPFTATTSNTSHQSSTDSEEEDEVSPISPTRVSQKTSCNVEVSRGKDKSEAAAVIGEDAQMMSGESSEEEIKQDEENGTSLKAGKEVEDDPPKKIDKHGGSPTTVNPLLSAQSIVNEEFSQSANITAGSCPQKEADTTINNSGAGVSRNQDLHEINEGTLLDKGEAHVETSHGVSSPHIKSSKNTRHEQKNADQDHPSSTAEVPERKIEVTDGSKTPPTERCTDSSFSSSSSSSLSSSSTTSTSSSSVQHSENHMVSIPMEIVKERSQASGIDDGGDQDKKDEISNVPILENSVTAEHLKDMQDLIDEFFCDRKELSTSIQDEGDNVAAREPRSPIEHDGHHKNMKSSETENLSKSENHNSHFEGECEMDEGHLEPQKAKCGSFVSPLMSVSPSRQCNGVLPESQSSASDVFVTAASAVETDVYDSAKDCTKWVKNEDEAQKLPSSNFANAFISDSETDVSDALSTVLFDVDENVCLKLQPSSGEDDNSTTFVAASLIEDESPPGSGRCQGMVEDEDLDVGLSSHSEHTPGKLSNADNSPIEQRGTDNAGSDAADDEHVELETYALGNGKARVRKVCNKAQAGCSGWNRIRSMSSDSSSSSTMPEDPKHKITKQGSLFQARKRKTAAVKKKIVARRKRRSFREESERSSTEEPEIRRCIPQGTMKPSKRSFSLHSKSVCKSVKTDKEEKQSQQDTSRSCKMSEGSSDPASNIDNFTGRYDYTFNPQHGLTRKLPQHCNKPKPVLKDSYTIQEDLDILKYIESKRVFHRVGGREMWQEMEQSQSLSRPSNYRTWHSLKERFRKRIMHRLHTYIQFGLSNESLQRFVHRIDIKPEEPMQRAVHNVTFRQPYSFAEDHMIVKFIIRNQRYSEVAGKAMWVLMTNTERGLNGRTWLSLKERFRKSIIYNIDKFGLSKEEVEFFKNKSGADARQKKRKELIQGKSKSKKNEESNVYSFDEEEDSPGMTESILGLKLKKSHPAKIQKKLIISSKTSFDDDDELEEMDEREAIEKEKICTMTQENKNHQPSTSGYVSPQREYIRKRERRIHNRHRRIANRDSSCNLPQKKKLFTNDNSMVDLSPCTPFTRDSNGVSNIGNNLKKQKKRSVTKQIEEDHDKKKRMSKDIRVLLDKSWSAKKRKMDGREKRKLPGNKEDDTTTATKNEDKTVDEEASQSISLRSDKPSQDTHMEQEGSKPRRGKPGNMDSDEGSITIKKLRSKDSIGIKGLKRIMDDTKRREDDEGDPADSSSTKNLSEKINTKSPTKRELEGVSSANSAQEKNLPIKLPIESKISDLPTETEAKICSSKLVPQIKLRRLESSKYPYLKIGSKGSMSASTSIDVEHTPSSTEKYTVKSYSEISKKKNRSGRLKKISHPIPIESNMKIETKFQSYMRLPRSKLRKKPIQEDGLSKS